MTVDSVDYSAIESLFACNSVAFVLYSADKIEALSLL
jgi:hypothetical protein